MTEYHQLSDGDESAEEFLQRISGKRSAAAPSASRRPPRTGQPGRRPDGSPTQARPLSLEDVLRPAARPWIPASASLGIWGGGQWLNGQRTLGALFLVLELFAASIIYCLTATWRSWIGLADLFFVPESKVLVAAFWAGALVPALTIAAILQAYAHAARRRRIVPFGGPAPVPMMASAIVPGWGQMLNGEGAKASVFLAVWLFGLYTLAVSWIRPEFWSAFDPTRRLLVGYDLTAVQLGALTAVGLACVVSVYDALLTARRQRVA